MRADPLHLIGATVDARYDVAEFVEQRGSRFVYRGLHRLWGEPVAIALHLDDPSTPPQVREEARRGYMRAGALMSRLATRSSAFVQPRDAGVLMHARGELPYNVYEWIEGSSLFDVLAAARGQGSARLGLASALEWFAEPMRALGFAHEAGVVHGRIDPHNLIVVGGSFRPPGQIKIRGFTNAAWQVAMRRAVERPLPADPTYAPPELHSPDHASLTGPWTDVYGLARIFVELLLGQAPPPGPVGQHIEPYVPRDARFALERALANRPEDRFRTLELFRHALLESMGMATGANKRRSPRRTMVVADQKVDAGSAGAFETAVEDSHQSEPEPEPDAPRARVRLAYTQRISAADLPHAPAPTPRPAPRRTVLAPEMPPASDGQTAPRPAVAGKPQATPGRSNRRASDSFTSGLAAPRELAAAHAAQARNRLIVVVLVVAVVMGMAGYLFALMLSR